jgi:hypothetical protein
VYLLGHDLAYDAGGASHWKSCTFAEGAFESERKAKVGGYDDRMVMGNNGEMVPTCMWWDYFRGEITSQFPIINHGRKRIFNVNAFTKKYAKLGDAMPSLLPNPKDWPELGDLRSVLASRRNPDRLKDWQKRAAKLDSDAENMQRAYADYANELSLLHTKPLKDRDAKIIERFTPIMGCSEGNADAFRYLLRSFYHNEWAILSANMQRVPVSVDHLSQSLGMALALTQHMVTAYARSIPGIIEQFRPSFRNIAGSHC